MIWADVRKFEALGWAYGRKWRLVAQNGVFCGPGDYQKFMG